jgi:hypothetical protein
VVLDYGVNGLPHIPTAARMQSEAATTSYRVHPPPDPGGATEGMRR